MKIPWPAVAGWYHATLLAALAWLPAVRPGWAPLCAAAALPVHLTVARDRCTEPWASGLTAASATSFVVLSGGWRVTAGWLLLAGLVAMVARILPRAGSARPDIADLVAAGGWAAVFLLAPRLLDFAAGGWAAPAVLLYAAQRLARTDLHRGLGSGILGPPTREVRGTLSLDGVVLVGADGLPASAPIDLELRAGESLAVICDRPDEASMLASTLAGRTPPYSGRVMVDGAPAPSGGRLVAMVAVGERFLDGDLERNLAALSDRPIDRARLGAVFEVAFLNEIPGGRKGLVSEAGEPMSPFHRLLVLAARVIVSDYRLVVVVDPSPWVDAVRGERWRAVVVRASTGRTAVWMTADRELASRASRAVELRDGVLRPFSLGD